jgi:hypothetical protein
LENLANQKKPALQSTVDAHHTAIKNCYLSNDDWSAMDSNCMEAANDNRSINRCLYSNFDNDFTTFLDCPPSARKKGAERNVECKEKPAKKKRETIAASSSNSNNKDMSYTQSTLAFAKGLKEPLAFLSNTE